MTTTTTDPTVWINDNGMIACRIHGGYSLKAEATAHPRARMLYTDRDSWLRMDTDGVAMLRDMYPTGPLCEVCRHGELSDR